MVKAIQKRYDVGMTTIRYFEQRQKYSENPEIFTYESLAEDFKYKICIFCEDLAGWIDRDRNDGQFTLSVWGLILTRALSLGSSPSSFRQWMIKTDVSGFF